MVSVYMDKHDTRSAAVASARSKANEEIETRVAKVTIEVLEKVDKVPGKKRAPFVIPGLGVVGGL